MTAKMQPFWYFLKPPFACPTGEQIQNRGFEAGSWTPWTHSAEDSYITNMYKRSGSYGAIIGAHYVGGGVWSYGWIKQVFPTPIRSECFKTFEFWACTPTAIFTYFRVTIYYSDATETTIDTNVSSFTWLKFDLLGYLDAGKNVSGWKVEATGGTPTPIAGMAVDDFSGVCAQP